jgi:RNA polymerase sigma-70 factor (ECF subfamily)
MSHEVRDEHAAIRTTEHPAVTHDDDVLVTLFQGGDRDAFRLLVERHERRVRAMIASLLGSRSAVDDIAQDVFLNVWRALPGFRFDAAFGTWLYRIVLNRCRDEIRTRRVRRILSLNGLLEARDREIEARLVTHPVDTELPDLIAAELAALPPRYKEPIILKDVDGRSYDDIASILQIEIGTVKSRLARGRAVLRDRLRERLDGYTLPSGAQGVKGGSA